MKSILVRRSSPMRRYAALCAVCILLLGALVFVFYDHLFREPRPREARVGITVPPLVGASVDTAKSQLEQAYFDIQTHYLHDNDVPAGVILRQTPAAGTYRKIADGERVTLQLSVSLGPAYESVPDLIGKESREAQLALEEKGFSVKTICRTASGIGGHASRVWATEPRAGCRLVQGDTVTLYVTEPRATPSVRCPSLIGLDRMSALATLRAAGLTVGTVTTVPSDGQADPDTHLSAFWAGDVVIEQERPAGCLLPQGSAVNIVLQKNDFFDFFNPFETNRKDSLFYG